MHKIVVGAMIVSIFELLSGPLNAQERQPPQRRPDPAEGKEIAPEEKIRALIAQLGDDDIKVREAAEGSLIDLGEPARTALQAAARSDDAEVKRRAEYALRVIDLKGKVTFSEKLLKWYPEIYRDLAKGPTVREYCAIFQKLTAFDFEKRTRTVEVENADIGELIKLLAKENYAGLTAAERRNVARVCGGEYRSKTEDGETEYLSDAFVLKESTGGIVPLLKDPDPEVRGRATFALGQMKATEYAKDLVPLLKNGDSSARWIHEIVRGIAVMVLGKTGYDQEIFPLLTQCAEDIRDMAEGVLCEMTARKFARQIRPLLKNQSADTRGWTALALVELGAEKIVPQDGIKDMQFLMRKDDAISRRAEAALKALGVSDEGIRKAKEGNE